MAGACAGLVQLAGVVSALLIPLGAHAGEPITEGFAALGLPATGNALLALLLWQIGAAAHRRKRFAWAALVALEAGALLLDVLALVGRPVHGWGPLLATPSPMTWEIAGSAVVSAGLLALLWALRPVFCVPTVPGAARRAAGVLGAGLAGVLVVGWGLASVVPGRLDLGELIWSADQVTGELIVYPDRAGTGPFLIELVVRVLGLAVVGCAMHVLARTPESRPLTADDELRVRELLADSGEQDSLGYFATRRDRSTTFAPSGRAAVAYSVFQGMCLASGDPIGAQESWPEAIEAWLAHARRNGWVPCVVAVSERGARAYAAAGMKVLRVGDEAILDVDGFSAAGPGMKSVRQAANRLKRAGYEVVIRRHGEIPEAHLGHLLKLCRAWRDTAKELGFSMALSRLGDPADERCVMVEAYDGDGELRALQSFAPWGRSGLSLDLMRRHPDAANGLNELLVTELVRAAPELGVHRISLNFSTFRWIFAQADEVGAWPLVRFCSWVLRRLTGPLQFESLYRANDKYRPTWKPQYGCYTGLRTLPRSILTLLAAEGYVPEPTLHPRRRELAAGTSDAAFARLARQASERSDQPDRRVPEQTRVRLRKLEQLRERGVEAYPAAFDRDRLIAEVRGKFGDLSPDVRTGHEVAIAGRVVAERRHGGLCFAVLRDFSGDIQVMLAADELGADELAAWKSATDLGDHLGVRGEVITSRRGELSVLARSWTLTGKCLHPLPDKRKGLAAPETRVRQRYLDLIVNRDAPDMLRRRVALLEALRDSLRADDFLEVETPMLQAVHGGANARPFTTHINAYDMPMYLRIAPELYLKRLCVAGVDRIFELNRNFRNEGVDATHNPEFTMLEAYRAYADYSDMRYLVRDLVTRAAVAVHGAAVARRRAADGTITEHDLSGPWPVITVYDAVSTALGAEITPDTPVDELARHCTRADVPVDPAHGHGQLVLAAYEHLVEGSTELPTFYTDFPTEVSPLTRQHRDDPRLAERWDLVAFGTEIATAYSELTDPVEQRRRLVAQSLEAAGGDVEAMALDEDFLRALEYGMPPTGGLGLGVDRLLMMLTGASIRQTVLFPFVRPER